MTVAPRKLLLIMAKLPIAGASKTRLHPVLEPRDAAELARCFLLDSATLGQTVAREIVGLEVAVAGSPAESEAAFAELLPGLNFVAQRGVDLSERLDHAMAEGFRQGFDQVVAINADSPTLPRDYVAQAFEYLADPCIDAVFGPAEDGGYYLIGCSQHRPELVRGITMSTPTVLVDTLALAIKAGVKTALLPPWYDVDEPEDLARLQAELLAGEPCGNATKRFLLTDPGCS